MTGPHAARYQLPWAASKLALSELRRIASHYYLGVMRDSGGRTGQLAQSLYRVLSARLRYGVGPRYYALFELNRFPQSSWSDFVTDTPAFKHLLKGLSPEHAHVTAKDKIRFYQHCLQHQLPTIPILGALLRNPPRKSYASMSCVTDVHGWRKVLADAPGELFIKPVDGTFGLNAFVLSRQGDLYRFANRTGSDEDVFAYMVAGLKSERGWLIQPRLRCHPELQGIMGSQGLGTVRLVTCMKDGKASLLFAVIKLTVGDNVTDNFHYGTTGNLLAPIDPDTGTLRSARGSLSKSWPAMASVRQHPDTGHAIEGFVVPAWDEIVRLTLRAQESLPQLATSGWDVTLTREGPVLVEVNNTYSMDILQVAYQRGLKSELMRELASSRGPSAGGRPVRL